MQVRCPHCHNPVEILDDSSFKDILCSTCGSNFSLVGGTDATETAHHAAKTIGQFELVEQLGVGAFGTVWKAKDTQLDRMVAIKIPRKGQLSEDETEKFLREARAAAQLRHASIVSVHEVGKSDDSVYIVSDYVEGADLKEWMRGQSLPAKEAAELCAKIAEALHHAHEQGVIHRDLKPGNIMMDLEGQPHIMDFGLAKRESGEMTMTVDGAILGTPAYMSPEQAKGKGHEADRRSDVYSLGTMLFELLTGELPFRGEKRMLVVSILTEEPPKLRRLNPRVPKDLETICLKCMEKEPARRYATAKDLADDLRRYLIGEPIGARPISGVGAAWRWSRRHPAGAGLMAASGVATLMLMGLLVGYGYQQRLESTNLQLAEAQDNLERVLYFRKVSQALSAWHENQVARAERLLEECPTKWRHWEWYYVNRLRHAGVLTLEGHHGWVRGVAFSPDGRYVASASTDNTIRVWDTEAERIPLVLNGDPDMASLEDFSLGIYYGFFEVAFSRDGKHIVSGSGNERASGREVYAHNTVRIWDAKNSSEFRSFGGHAGVVSCVAFSPDGRWVASGSWDQSVKLWSVNTGQVVHTLKEHTSWVYTVAFSPDGKCVASVSQDGKIVIWNAETGEKLIAITRATGSGGVAFSPDGQRIATGGGDGKIRIWNTESGKEVGVLEGHTDFVGSVVFSPNGERIVSGSHDKLVKIWSVETGREIVTLRGHKNSVSDVDFSPDGERVVSGSRDRTVKVWDAETVPGARMLTGHSERTALFDHISFVDIAFSPDGRRIAGGSADSTVKVWDVASSQIILTLKGHTDAVNSVAFSVDGRQIASASSDKTLKLWNANSGELILTLEGQRSQNNSIAFSPDGGRIVSNTGQETITVWDTATGEELNTLEGHAGSIRRVAFSLDGNRIATASKDNTAKLWDANTGEEVCTLIGHSYFVNSVSFSPNGQWIATGSWDNTVRVWDVDSGEAIRLLDAGTWVNDIVFSPDSRRIAAAVQDGTVKTWDVQSGEESLTIRAHSGAVSGVAFSPNGQLLVSRSKDNTIKIWDAGTTEFIGRSN